MNKKPARPGKSGFRQDKGRAQGGKKPFRNSSGDKNKGTFNAKPSLRRQFDNDSHGGGSGGGFRREGGNSERPPFRKRFDNDSNNGGGGGFRREGGNSERPPFRKRFDNDSNGGGSGGGFRREGGNSERPPFRKRFDNDSNGGGSGGGFRREGGNSDRPPFRKRFDNDSNNGGGGGGFRREGGNSERPPFRKRFDNDSNGGGSGGGFRREGGNSERPPFRKRFDNDSNGGGSGGGFRRESGNSERPPFRKRFDNDSNGGGSGGGFRREGGNSDRPPFRKRFDNDSNGGGGFRREGGNQRGGNNQDKGGYWWKDIPEGYERNSKSASPRRRTQNNPRTPDYDMSKIKGIGESKGVKSNPGDGIRLNRFIANAGISSRREADTIIESGRVLINGKVITEMGYRVKPSDRVELDGETLKRERSVYVLLNKPKDFITTTDDPQERKTVMELVEDACEERIYPVGRLDRNTTGLLLLTNDGALAEKLSHPSNQVKKNYQLELNKPLEEAHFDQIMRGIELEDGFIKPDKLSYMTDDRMILSIDIHSGKNRIVRRIFEHFGYEVVRLDRATYAGLTKKALPRGQWRFLTQQEVIRLKFFTGRNKKTTSEE